LMVVGGIVIAKRKTRAFPYGLYKVENLAAVILALAILYAGYEIAVEAIRGKTTELQNVGTTITSVLSAIGVAFIYARYAAGVGREINSPSLIADAKHIGVDVFAGGAVLAGLMGSLAGLDLDRVTAFIVVAIIVWSGSKILTDGIRVLLDASLDYNTLSQAEKLILAEPQVVAIENLTGRNSGRYKFVEANIVLKEHELEKAAFIANRIADRISEQIENVDRVLIHYEPILKDNFVYALPLQDNRHRRISDHFGDAPCFALITVKLEDYRVIKQEILANPFTHVNQGKGILVAEFLIKHAVDAVITREGFAGKGPFYVFSNAAVDTLQTVEDTLEKALKTMGVSIE